MKITLKCITIYLLIYLLLFGLLPGTAYESYNKVFAEFEDEAILDIQNDTQATPTPNKPDDSTINNEENSNTNTTPAETVSAEIKNYTNMQQIELLTSLKILIVDEVGEPNEPMTRGQMAQIVARIMNCQSEVYVSDEKTFADVPADNAMAPYINFISSNGILNGDADGNFYPDRNITYAEAVKMLMTLIGYREIAEQRGGYPSGYFAVASENKLLSGIALENDQQINKNSIYTMVYNAMQCDMLVKTSFGNSVTYKTTPGYTVLNEYLKIKKYKGIMVDNGDTKLDEVSKIRKDQIAINVQKEDAAIVFDSKNLDDKDMLGHSVECYAKEDETTDTKEVVYLKSVDLKNNVLTIQVEDIIQYDNKIYRYTDESENAKQLDATIGQLTDKIYNGVAYPDITDANMVPVSGNIVLIDNDYNGIYDVVLIHDYKTMVVDFVNKEDQILRDRYNLETLDLDSDNNIVRVREKDGWTDFYSITQWSVLTVLQSKTKIGQKFLVTIYVSNEEVSGKLDEIVDGYDKVIIDGTEYKLTSEFKGTAQTTDLLSIGETYTFYMDIDGKIAAVKNDYRVDSRYVLLMNAAMPNGLRNLQLKVFTNSKKIEMVDVSNRCIVNGVKKTNDEFLTLLKQNQENVPVQLIKITKDADNVVKEVEMWQDLSIKLVANASSEYPNIDPINTDKSALYRNVRESALNYKKVTKSFDGYFTVDDSTIIFKVPTDTTSDKDYEVISTKQLSEGTFDVSAYNVSDIGVAKVVVITKETWFITPAYTEMIGIVDHTSKAFDEEKNDFVKKVYMYKGGVLTSIILPDDLALLPTGVTFDGLHKGDIIRYALNPRNNKIWYFIRHFDINNRITQVKEFNYSNGLSQDFDYSLRFAYGQPYTLRGSVMRLMVTGAKNAYFFDLSKANIYYFKMNSHNGEILSGDINSITDYQTTMDWGKTSNIFVKTIKGEAKEVVVYDFDN